MIIPAPRSTYGKPRLRLGLVALLCSAGSLACIDHPPTEDDPELRALLDDKELEGVIRQAQVAVSDAGAPIPGGGMAGSGGTGGEGTGGVGGGTGGMGVPTDGGIPCAPSGSGGMGGPRPPLPPAQDAGAGGSGGSIGGCFTGPLARWELDDCNPGRTELRDDTSGFTAFRSVKAQCVPGAEGQGVTLPNDKDLLYVPDQPLFNFDGGVTVAAWIKPDKLTGTQTIFRKREGGTSSVALMLVDKKFTFIVDRVGGGPIAVTAPAKRVGAWQHVAATFDGADLRLYLDGVQAATVHKAATIKGGEGPLLFGNDGTQRRFAGALDKLWFDVHAAPASVIQSLLCLHKPATLKGTPAMSMSVQPGTPVTFDFAITSNSSPECQAENMVLQSNTFQPDFTIEPSFQFLTVQSGKTAHVPVTITSSEDIDSGSFPFTFSVFSFDRFDPAGLPTATVTYVAQATGCRVSTGRELMIRDVSVVDDPIRTDFTAPATDSRRGKWTFKHLIEELSPTAAQAPDIAEAMFKSFTTPQTVNGFTIEERPGMQTQILDGWPRVNGKLDLTKAPLRLLAIVNRMDLRNLDQGNAGEGRFVFGFIGAGGFPLQATLILEYQLQATTEAQVKALANAWHALGSLPFPSEQYNAALEAITEGFAKRGAAPGKPNGSGLGQLRTNEIDLGTNGIWQLREFTIDATGKLVPSVIKLTPDRPSFDNTATLGDFVNMNETSILAERHTVPLQFQGKSFGVGSVFNDLTTWRSQSITNPEARHKFALNTCNGCHSIEETGTFFLQVNPRFPGEQAGLSGFLTGITVSDPVTGDQRTFRDLSRRNADLKMLVCPATTATAPTTATATGSGSSTSSTPAPTVRRGIGRVH